MSNINDYNALPSTPYRQFVDKIQERIAFINTQPMSDESRLDALAGALLSLLGVDPDEDITWEDDDDEY